MVRRWLCSSIVPDRASELRPAPVARRWNSSGPRTVAAAGAVCVCIRHRGALPPPPTGAGTVLALLGATTLLAALLPPPFSTPAVAAAGWLLLLLLYIALADGSATFSDMMDDVAAALARIRKDKETLIPPNAAKALGYGLLSDAPAALSGRVYLGGYSSGAHVAAALLLPRRASTLALARHGLPTDPTRLCDCVLYLSGVFGGSAPGWPAVLARLVFGPAGGTALPSPLLRAAETPQLPHVHIRCETEAFGLPVIEPVMQAMLSGTAYEEALRRACIPLRVHVVHSNHWNVLTSPGLSEALRAELHALPPCKASIREKSGIAWQLRCLWGG